MWILFARVARPDAVIWPGRTLLAALDAVVWPGLLFWATSALPGASGVVRPVLLALVALTAIKRLQRAVWSNHRYRFTTWWIVRLLAILWAVGMVLKLVLPWPGPLDQWFDGSRPSLQRSRSVRRQATARSPNRTGTGNMFLAINR
jgi:hypothetical protein